MIGDPLVIVGIVAAMPMGATIGPLVVAVLVFFVGLAVGVVSSVPKRQYPPPTAAYESAIQSIRCRLSLLDLLVGFREATTIAAYTIGNWVLASSQTSAGNSGQKKTPPLPTTG